MFLAALKIIQWNQTNTAFETNTAFFRRKATIKMIYHHDVIPTVCNTRHEN